MIFKELLERFRAWLRQQTIEGLSENFTFVAETCQDIKDFFEGAVQVCFLLAWFALIWFTPVVILWFLTGSDVVLVTGGQFAMLFTMWSVIRRNKPPDDPEVEKKPLDPTDNLPPPSRG